MKVKIGNLPEGFKIVNGKVVRTMKAGGTVNNTLGPMNREDANLEAEKGETALTDLTNDGSFELYNIGGKRHYDGGTPLNLPEQSFVFSDTRKMKFTIEELKQLGIDSKKKMTPAKVSKRFPLNKYIEILENPDSDKIAVETAEDMLNKNKVKLSQIAFLQEQKKKFADGVPLAAYPYMIENGINPQEFEAKLQQGQQQMAMGPDMNALQQFTGGPQMSVGGGTDNPGFRALPDFVQSKILKNAGMGGEETHTMPDGTVHPGATHEEYMAMMQQGQSNMYKMGGSAICPTCGKKLPCGCKYKMGGSPFEENPLKRFTEGGAPEEMLGMSSRQGRLSDSQIALQNIMIYRQKLMDEYESTAAYVKDNPNVLADPEKANELKASIQTMETQLREIDIQTQSIQQSMMQQSLQVNPFEGMRGVEPQQQMAQFGTELTGSDAWGYSGDDADGNPIIGSSEPVQETYNPEQTGYESHAKAFDIMSSKDFDPVRKLWLDKYKEEAAKNPTGKRRWVSKKSDGTEYSDAELFHIFNRMNQYLSAVNAGEGKNPGEVFGKNAAGNTDELAIKYGYGKSKPTEEEIRIFQGMYKALDNAKIADESGLLDQINTTPIGQKQEGMTNALGENVSFVDGKLGHTTGGQFYRAENPDETSTTTTEVTNECDAETRAKIMQECKELKLNFDQKTCSCVAKPGDFETPKTPLYETFPQDDLIVATKSAQLAGLKQINPVLEPSVDPTLMNPMYVDPRQQLSVIEATAAEAIRQNPDQATAIMGKMQDASEGIINKHENLNTKIYNNAQAINIPLINDAAEANATKFKTFMDESNASAENFQVASMEMQDNLVNAVNDQMSNADQQYMENLKNPQFWYSPQAHNIEYYNPRGFDGKSGQPTTDSMLAYEEYKALADKDPDFAEKYFDKIYKPKKNPADEVNITRNNAQETVKYGKETSRKRDLLRSKRELRKWILGYK